MGGSGRRGITAVAWNPEVATQLVTASEDDDNPVIMLWDLQQAHAPSKILSGHSKGILSLSWCGMDSELLLSCGKDNRTICWNPKTGEMVGEFPQNNNWAFDVQWSPRNPNLLSTASFDGKVSIYSLQSNYESESAPAEPAVNDPFAPPVVHHQPFSLKQPPKWYRRPVGATFGFGNKLVRFGRSAPSKPKQVSVNVISTDQELINRASKLEESINNDDFQQITEDNISTSKNDEDKFIWSILQMMLQDDFRTKLVDLLKEKKGIKPETPAESPEPESQETEAEKAQDGQEASEETQPTEDQVSNLFEGGSQNEAEDFFSKPIPTADVSESQDSTIQLPKVQDSPFSIGASEDGYKGTLVKHIIIGDFAGAVSVCMKEKLYADALIVAAAGGPELLLKVQSEIFEIRKDEGSYFRLLNGINTKDLTDVVHNADLSEWEIVLMMICNYSSGDDFEKYCSLLGQRLLKSDDAASSRNALLCFLASGKIHQAIPLFIKQQKSRDGEEQDSHTDFKNFEVLQDLVEQLTVFLRAINFVHPSFDTQNYNEDPNSQVIDSSLKALYDVYFEYAKYLTSQGCTQQASQILSRIPATYQKLDSSSYDQIAILKYQLYYLGLNSAVDQVPYFPFTESQITFPGEVVQSQSQTQPQAKTQTHRQAPVAQQSTYTQPAATATYDQTGYYDQTNTQSYYGQTAEQNTYANQGYQYQSTPSVPMPDYNSAYNTYNTYAQPSVPSIPTFPGMQDSTNHPQSHIYSTKDGGSWNDPPTDAFKKATKPPTSSSGSTPKPQAILSPFANASQPPMQPLSPQAQYGFGQANVPPPPPPNAAHAPTPMYARKPEAPRPGPATQQPIHPPQPVTRPNLPPPPQGPPSGFQPNQHAQRPPQQAHQPPQGFAPPPTGAQRPPQGFAPPPGPGPQQFHQPPPTRPVFSPPNPVQQSAPAPAPAAAPPRPKPATVDPSQIPPNNKPIYDILNGKLLHVKKAPLPPAVQKQVASVEKSLGSLFQIMSSKSLNPALVEPLIQISKSIEARDYPAALSLHSKLATDHYDKVGPWTSGIKFLINILKSTP
jgi:protein transport protein SEC31